MTDISRAHDRSEQNAAEHKRRYRCFTRTWWKDNPAYPNGLEPCAGPRHYAGHPKRLTLEEAQAYCRQWNESHAPGRLSRKCEFEEL